MIRIYREAWEGFRTIFWSLVLASVTLELAPVLLGDTGSLGLTIFVLASVGYTAHRYFLFGETGLEKRGTHAVKPRLGRFFLVTIAAIVLLIAISLLVVDFRTFADGRPPTLGVSLTVGAIWAVLLTGFGTIFPAAAAGTSLSLNAILRRIRIGFVPTVVGFVIGPLPFYLMFFGALMVVGNFWTVPDYVSGAPLAENVVALTAGALLRLIGFFGTMLAVAVLCDAYRRAEPAPLGPSAAPDVAGELS